MTSVNKVATGIAVMDLIMAAVSAAAGEYEWALALTLLSILLLLSTRLDLED